MATVARRGRERRAARSQAWAARWGGLAPGQGAAIIRGPRILLTKWELREGNGRV